MPKPRWTKDQEELVALYGVCLICRAPRCVETVELCDSDGNITGRSSMLVCSEHCTLHKPNVVRRLDGILFDDD